MTQMQIPPHDSEEFERPDEPSTPVVFSESLLGRGKRAARLAGSFLLGQGVTQALSAFTGLFLVRRLSVEAYAQFGVATGFQSVFTILMDLGFASTIVPLVGDRSGDRALVGRYVRSARRMRDRTFLILAPIAAVAFFFTARKHHWGAAVECTLLASILLSLYSSGMVSFFSAPLFLRGKVQEYYLPQGITGAARLALYQLLSVFKGLNSWTAALLGAFSVTCNGWLIRRAANKYMDWPRHADPEVEKELFRFVLPAMPAIVFAAFQSQISLFLISIFGSTLYIAEVAALGRIGALFLLLTTFHTVVLEPYVARLSRIRLLRTYLVLILLALVACAPVVWMAFRWPIAFVWVLGPKFAGLQPLIGLYVLSACANFISGMVWIMNRARRWVFWSGSVVEVALLLGVQLLFLLLVGMHNTRQAVEFMLASSGCYAIAHGCVAVKGFLQKV
jgi:O-antigen/teichoic acid export membrane protein